MRVPLSSRSHKVHQLLSRLRHSFRRRCAVQNLERWELLAGDFTFSSLFQSPYQIIEDGSLFGSIDLETALPAGSQELGIQLPLEQSTSEASLSLDCISEEKIVYITAGETSSNLFLVTGVPNSSQVFAVLLRLSAMPGFQRARLNLARLPFALIADLHSSKICTKAGVWEELLW